MRAIYLLLAIAIILVGAVIAQQVTTTSFTKSNEMNKTTRDYLISKLPTTAVKEIKPTINIECSSKECKYSAVQNGIISSYDNVISREYCSEYDKNDNITCLRTGIYTITEIQDQVTSSVMNKITDFAVSGMNQENKSTTETSIGNLTIVEKR